MFSFPTREEIRRRAVELNDDKKARNELQVCHEEPNFCARVDGSLVFSTGCTRKAETVKVTVSGGELAKTIDVTNPGILDLSHAWGESFLDTSRPPIDQSPQRPWPYEVSFYSLIGENDVRKTRVLYYYPSNSTDPGLSICQAVVARFGR